MRTLGLARLAPFLLLGGCAHGSAISLDLSGECPRVAPGNTYRGEATRKHPRFGWLQPIEVCFEGRQGDRVNFRMTSKVGDDNRRGALLSVERAQEDLDEMHLRGMDVSTANTDAATTASMLLPVTGTYRLSFFTGAPKATDRHAFQLEFLPIRSHMTELKEGVVVEGTLDDNDGVDQDGTVSDLYLFRAPRNQMHVYRYVVKSTDFTPALWLRSSRLNLPPQNEFGDADYRTMENGDVFLEVRAQPGGAKRGRYTIEVTDLVARRQREAAAKGGDPDAAGTKSPSDASADCHRKCLQLAKQGQLREGLTIEQCESSLCN